MLKVVGASWLQTKISTYILVGMGILGIVSLFIGEIERIADDGNFAATVNWYEDSFNFEFWGQGNELEEIPKGAARAYYRSDIKENGWAKLEIETNVDYPSWAQAYAAGLIEGALTWQVIHWQWKNTIESRCLKYPNDCKLIREILKANFETVHERSLASEDSFWFQIKLFHRQILGLFKGYNYIIKRNNNDEIEIPLEDFYWLNAFSDVSVIERVYNITREAQPGGDLPGLAAAFIRLIPDQPANKESTKEGIIIAHNSAGSYNSMLRIMKHYKFNYHKNLLPTSPLVPGSSIVFAGYPGAISSSDDMYSVSGSKNHRLVVTGTAINNFNPELWAKVNLEDHALIGPRVMAANRLANSGIEWVRFISRVNSGTTPAQWSIVNLSKLAHLNASTVPAQSSHTQTPEQSDHRYIFSTIDEDLKSVNFSLWRTLRRKVLAQSAPGLLWTAEQLPGLTHAADQSNVLRANGYWADYGIPHYQDMKELSGIKKMELKHGEMYSSSSSPRAIYFKNGFESANDVESVTYLMRSNQYIDSNKVDSNQEMTSDNSEEIMGEIEPEDIVSTSEEKDKIIRSLKFVVSEVVSTDNDSVASILTAHEQQQITHMVNEILKYLESSEDSEESESESKELNLDPNSFEEVENKIVNEGSWHGLGARGDLRGWLGEKRYGLLPFGVIDTKIFNTTIGGSNDFIAISGPAYAKALETPIQSLLTPDTRSKTRFGLSELLHKFRQSNLRFVSDEESEEKETEATNEEEPLDFEEALYNVVNKTIQIDAPNSVPPFEWSSSKFLNISHVGHPDKWRFNPIKPHWIW